MDMVTSLSYDPLNLLVLYNVFSDSSKSRIQCLKDILFRFDDCTKLVVTSGSDTSLFTSLRIPLDHTISFKGNSASRTRKV